MSAGLLPYALRQNKYVDRRIFVDLLTRVERFRPLRDYAYVGLGGAGLEDHKLVHSILGLTRLVSLDQSEHMVKRQEFNKPVECVRCKAASTKQFLDNFEQHFEEVGVSPDTSFIVWFDYTSPRSLGRQLQEFLLLLERLSDGDLVRITVNANPSAYGERTHSGETAQELHTRRREALAAMLGEFTPADLGPDYMTRNRLPLFIARAFRLAAQKASLRPERTFFPLSLIRYADGQQMLSITGILLPRGELNPFLAATDMETWDFYSRSWDHIEHVEIPYLTLRERMFLDQLLPKGEPEEILRAMKFVVGEDERDSRAILATYKRFYRFYPQFHHVAY